MRKISLLTANSWVATIEIGGNIYFQTPSNLADISNTKSIYSHSYGQPKEGASHSKGTDTRFGIAETPGTVHHYQSHNKKYRKFQPLYTGTMNDANNSKKARAEFQMNSRGSGRELSLVGQRNCIHDISSVEPKYSDRAQVNTAQGRLPYSENARGHGVRHSHTYTRYSGSHPGAVRRQGGGDTQEHFNTQRHDQFNMLVST